MSDQPQLIQVKTGKRIPVTKDLLVGRQEGCDVRLTEGKASRQHAKVGTTDGGLWVEDLRSSNGTFVNNARVQKRTPLRSGDRVRFDVEEFEIHLPSDEKTAMREAEPPRPISITGGSKGSNLPGSWAADPDVPKSKTAFISQAELAAIMGVALPDLDNQDVTEPHLEVLSGRRAKTIIRLIVGNDDADEWLIGSQDDRDIQFDDPGVSAVHAKLSYQGGRWRVNDQMSANGTFVNNTRSLSSVLSSQDRVRFGPVDCVFRAPGRSRRSIGAGQTSESSGSKKWWLALGGFAVTVVVLFLVWKLRGGG